VGVLVPGCLVSLWSKIIKGGKPDLEGHITISDLSDLINDVYSQLSPYSSLIDDVHSIRDI
jgi:hypothetical protein